MSANSGIGEDNQIRANDVHNVDKKIKVNRIFSRNLTGLLVGSVLMGAVLFSTSCTGVKANNDGWISTGSGWEYYANGNKVTGWVSWNGNWYFIDANGIMKTGWVQDSKNWYYMYDSGAMAISTTTPDGFYVDSHGVWTTGAAPSGTVTKPSAFSAGVTGAVSSSGSPSSSGSSSGTSTSSGQQVGSIQTQYGSHTYGCTTQAQYDAVMSKVKSAVANMGTTIGNQYITRYADGDRAANYPKGSSDWRGLTSVENNDSYFINNTARKDLIPVMKGCGLSGSFTSSETDKTSSYASSAYDVLFNKAGTCQADAQLDSAIFDVLGYNTMVVAGNGDAKCIFNTAGKWWYVVGLRPTDTSGQHVSNPTY